ncbi:MAG: hypothetical protein BIFFINMI_01488 [Phycisphaerae bacterium]|nr:hypothetical protein [Phycisphaerae bacterium]
MNTRRAGVLLGLLGIVWACAPAMGGTIRADRSDSAYLSLADLYPSVGRIDTVARGGAYIGSGTLIGSNWVLTAGHMADKVTTMTFTIGGSTYSADQWVSYPTWKGNLGAGNDIALVHLSSSVSGIAAAQLYTGTSELGQVATFVGYGMTGTGLTGATVFDGQKRAGQNVLDAYYGGSGSKILMSDFDSPGKASDSHYGSSTPLNLEYLIAPGDSGGGVFIDVGGTSYLVGVNSFGIAWDRNIDSDYGDGMGVTRVSSYADWIDSILTGGIPAPSGGGGKGSGGGGKKGHDLEIGGTTAVPGPATLLLLLGGLPLAGGLRRRMR